MTSISLPVVASAPPLLKDAEVAYDELLRLASLARALDPSLPPAIRFFRRTPTDDRGSAPGRVVFTTDARASLENGLQDSAPVDLFDALKRSLPPGIVALLQARVTEATARPVPSGIVAQAFGAAHAAGRVQLEARPTNDPDFVIEASPALVPAVLGFRDDAFLADVAAAHFKRARAPGDDPAFDFIATVNTVRQALASDASRLPAPRIRAIIDGIRSLDGLPGEPPFEERAQQGWIAYSLLAGGAGWTKPLLAQAADVVKPFTAYQGVSPALAAVGRNDAVALQALIDGGVSPNAFLGPLPPVFGRDQAEVEAQTSSRPTLALVATVLGATEAVGQLVQRGALVDLPNSDGVTPLALAVAAGNEPLARVLVAAGANPRQADAEGVSPLDRAEGAMRAMLEAPASASAPSRPGMRR